jgi:hypothetical protein
MPFNEMASSRVLPAKIGYERDYRIYPLAFAWFPV